MMILKILKSRKWKSENEQQNVPLVIDEQVILKELNENMI